METLMMPFYYKRPETKQELFALIRTLEKKHSDYVFMSGGTDLVPMLKQQTISPHTLISLTALRGPTDVHTHKRRLIGSASIDAQTTLSNLASNPTIQRLFPIISSTAALVASPQIRNRATVGGNLLVNNRCVYFNQSEQNRCTQGQCFKAGGEACTLVPNTTPVCRARFVSDLAPIFMLLEANLKILGPTGERIVPISDFYLPDGIERHKLGKSDILTRIRVEAPGPSVLLAYKKLRIRKAIDFPSLGVGMLLHPQNDVTRLGVAVTGVITHPLLIWRTFPNGINPENLLSEVIHELNQAIVPLKQDFFSPSYRKKMVGVFVRRLFADLTKSSPGVTKT